MKLVLSTIIVGIVLFLLGWVIYGIVMADLYKQYFGHLSRSEADMKIWAFGVANLAQAFFLYIIYSKGYSGGSPIAEGFKFGILIGLLWSIPYVLFTWGGMTVAYTGAIIDGVIAFIMMMIACILTAVIHGKKEVKPAA